MLLSLCKRLIRSQTANLSFGLSNSLFRTSFLRLLCRMATTEEAGGDILGDFRKSVKEQVQYDNNIGEQVNSIAAIMIIDEQLEIQNKHIIISCVPQTGVFVHPTLKTIVLQTTGAYQAIYCFSQNRTPKLFDTHSKFLPPCVPVLVLMDERRCFLRLQQNIRQGASDETTPEVAARKISGLKFPASAGSSKNGYTRTPLQMPQHQNIQSQPEHIALSLILNLYFILLGGSCQKTQGNWSTHLGN